MELNVLYAVLSVLLVSSIALVGVAFLSFKEGFLQKYMLILVSFSTGALLGNVFLHFMPEIAEEAVVIERAFFLVLIGMLLSLAVEKFIHWHHCHDVECETHVHPVGTLILVGDAVHSLVDGVLIATAFMVNIPLGIATTLAIALHEIPQELGDFAVLLHSGFSKTKALLWNFASGLIGLLGVALVWWLAESVGNIELYLLPLAAGNFLYIAGSDLIPVLQKEESFRNSSVQFLTILAGVALMYGLITYGGDTHAYEEEIHHEEQHGEESLHLG